MKTDGSGNRAVLRMCQGAQPLSRAAPAGNSVRICRARGRNACHANAEKETVTARPTPSLQSSFLHRQSNQTIIRNETGPEIIQRKEGRPRPKGFGYRRDSMLAQLSDDETLPQDEPEQKGEK